jgi:hypothetical protein
MLSLLWVLSRVSPLEVAPPLFLLWWWQLLIYQGLCEIVIKLMQPGCVLDSCHESLSLDRDPCGYGWECFISYGSQFCKPIPSIHATTAVSLIQEIILPCCVDFLCSALSQLRLIYYDTVIVHTVKDWDKLWTPSLCSYHRVHRVHEPSLQHFWLKNKSENSKKRQSYKYIKVIQLL